MARIDINPKLLNVIILGFAFMFIFTAFQTCGLIQTTVLNSIHDQSNGTFNGDGYTSFTVIYGVFAIANWLAPSIIAVIGPKWSMLGAGVIYSLYISNFLLPITALLYVASAILGCGAAVIWTAQGNFLTINSDTETIGRHSGIFWAMLQCSMLFGNVFVFVQLQDSKSDISKHDREVIFVVLLSISAVGLFLLLFLRKGEDSTENLLFVQDDRSSTPTKPLDAMLRSFQLLKTKEMMFLSIFFAYTGLGLTFYSGVYSTCISFSHQFEGSKGLMAMSGIFIGIGEIMGGAAFGLFGKRTNIYGRDLIVLFGMITHFIALYLIYLILPADSPMDTTDNRSFIDSSPGVYLAIFCSFLLGLADSCFNTQVYSILGFMFPEDSAPAFALFKFVQSITAAIAFYYSKHLLLPYQLLILVIFGVMGCFSFFIIEWNTNKAFQDGFSQI